ncbi:hypothetical protein IAR50_002531 [Cryptococcus sp. DSM 104548]
MFSFRSLPHPYTLRIIHLLPPFFAVLTTLFLILSGVTGTRVGYYFVKVEYWGENDSSGEQEDGEVWELGGLGSCKVGQDCSGQTLNPAHWGSIHSLLVFHLASSAIFFIIAVAAYVLFRFSASPQTKRYGTVIPLFGPLFPCIVMISDISVGHKLELMDDVKSISREGAFWLGTVAFVMSVLWFLLVEYDGFLRRLQDGVDNELEVKEEKGVVNGLTQSAWGWWPWAERDEVSGNEDSGKKKTKKKASGKGKGSKR